MFYPAYLLTSGSVAVFRSEEFGMPTTGHWIWKSRCVGIAFHFYYIMIPMRATVESSASVLSYILMMALWRQSLGFFEDTRAQSLSPRCLTFAPLSKRWRSPSPAPMNWLFHVHSSSDMHRHWNDFNNFGHEPGINFRRETGSRSALAHPHLLKGGQNIHTFQWPKQGSFILPSTRLRSKILLENFVVRRRGWPCSWSSPSASPITGL